MSYIHVNTLAELIKLANGDEFLEETVWRGDDGSFIIGEGWPEQDVTCEYVEAGMLEEYATNGAQYESLTAHLFDLDGTLIVGYMDRPDKDFAAVKLLPGVLDKIKHLKWATGNNIAIVTNQAGVAFGYNSEADVQRKLCAVGAALEYGWIELHDGSDEPITLDTGARGEKGRGVLQVYVSYEHPKATIPQYQENYDAPTENRRKPSPNMLLEAFRIEGYTQYALMVGDRPEDEAAARNAGIAFQWAKDFFNAS